MPTLQATGYGPNSITTLQEDIAQNLPNLVNDFEQRYHVADASLSALGSSSFTTLSTTCDRSPIFKHIARMGPKIVPLVVEKLARDNTTTANIWAVLLYDALESDEQYRPSSAEKQANLPQCRARIVELNIQRNKVLADRLEALELQMERNSISSNMSSILGEEEFYDFCDLGQSIMTSTMLAYIRKRNRPWFFVLHQIAHEEELQATMFHPSAFFVKWMEFFERGEQDQVPFYFPSAHERHIYGGESDLPYPKDQNGIPIINTIEQLRPRQ